MVKFMMKCFFIATILLFGVLLGMQQANVGMKKMKGYDDPSFQGAFQISDRETGELEASVLGNKVTSHDIEQKQKQLEEVEAFNFFSVLGKKVAQGVTFVFEKVFSLIEVGIDKIVG
ncbi:YqxA family protein [Bacillus timonensis]|nr:YqxA family protein [Bacillus timonensis]